MSKSESASASMASAFNNDVHLVVLHHGLWGEPEHLKNLVKQLVETLDAEVSPRSAEGTPEKDTENQTTTSSTSSTDAGTLGNGTSSNASAAADHKRVVILNAASNTGTRTYDGIDWCAGRLCEEIDKEIQRLQSQGRKVTKFSIIGYSLGGLIARYAIGLLYSQGFFDKIEPVNFATFATPHTGVPTGKGFFWKIVTLVGSNFIGRTGTQLYCTDDGWDDEGPSASPSSAKTKTKKKTPLMVALSRPKSNFGKALGKFASIDIYANAVSDLSVPFRTAAIVDIDPWQGWPEGGELDRVGEGITIETDPDYPCLLTGIKIPESPPAKKPFKERVVTAIKNLKWPALLNPYKIPWRFPLNWLGVIFFPLALPLFIAFLVGRLWNQSRHSHVRVKDLERKWLSGQQLSEGDSAKYSRNHERNRLATAMGDTIKTFGEEDVADSSLEHHQSKPLTAPTITRQQSSRVNGHGNPLLNPKLGELGISFPILVDFTTDAQKYIKKVQVDLKPSEVIIQKNLNAIPGLRKHLAFFDGLRNSHAVIICRENPWSDYQRGEVVIRHFCDHFER